MNSQGADVLWIGNFSEAHQQTIQTLTASGHRVQCFADFTHVKANVPCDFLVSCECENVTEAIKELISCKNLQQMSNPNIESVLITHNISLEEKEAYFNQGGNILIISPFGAEELLAQIRQRQQNQQNQQVLSSQLTEASSMALMAMENASDFGLMINFVKDAINANDYHQLAENIFNCTRLFSTSCLLEIKTFNSLEYFYSDETFDEDVKKVLNVNKNENRLIQIGDITQINHNNLVCIVEGLPIHDDAQMGRILDSLVMLCDIADRFAKGLAMEEQFKHAEQSRHLFLTTLSHELKTPLNSVLGFSSALLNKNPDKPLGESGLDALQRIVDNTHQVNTIMNTLMEISEFDIDRKHFQEINVDRLMLRLNTEFSKKANAKNIDFSIHKLDGLVLMCNEKVLYNMLHHLIDNAIKFTEQGSVSINISEVQHAMFGNSIQFDICDTGIGIDAIHHQRIFNEIGQLNQEHNREHYGIGLGLYYVKQMCEQLEGEVSLVSQLGNGSTFSLLISTLMEENNNQQDLDCMLF